MNIAGLDVLLGLAVVGFCAGWVDAIAGGGGLITVPTLALAGLDPVSVLATNKLQSTFGSGSATLTFARAGHLDLREVWPVAVLSASGAVMGALLLTWLPVEVARQGLPVILVCVALYFGFAPRISDLDQPAKLHPILFMGLFIPFFGFYDGIFGPGTGSFFMLGFVSLMGLGIIKATARTKLANFASNMTALLILSASGHIVWTIGLVMGIAQFFGAKAGAKATMAKGSKLVRPMLVFICLALATRLATQPGQFVRVFFEHWFFRG